MLSELQRCDLPIFSLRVLALEGSYSSCAVLPRMSATLSRLFK